MAGVRLVMMTALLAAGACNLLRLDAGETRAMRLVWEHLVREPATEALVADTLRELQEHPADLLAARLGLAHVPAGQTTSRLVLEAGTRLAKVVDDGEQLSALLSQHMKWLRRQPYLAEVVLLAVASRLVDHVMGSTVLSLASHQHHVSHISFVMSKLAFGLAALVSGRPHRSSPLGLGPNQVARVRSLLDLAEEHPFRFGMYDALPESSVYERNKHARNMAANFTKLLAASLDRENAMFRILEKLAALLQVRDAYLMEQLLDQLYHIPQPEWSPLTEPQVVKDWDEWAHFSRQLAGEITASNSGPLHTFLRVAFHVPRAVASQSEHYPVSRAALRALYKCLSWLAVELMMMVQGNITAPFSVSFLGQL